MATLTQGFYSPEDFDFARHLGLGGDDGPTLTRIARCIDEAGGGTLYIGGDYHLDSPARFPAGIIVQGAGARRTKFLNRSDGPGIVFYGSGIPDLYLSGAIRDISVLGVDAHNQDSPEANWRGVGILLEGTRRVEISGVSAKNMETGILITSAGDSDESDEDDVVLNESSGFNVIDNSIVGRCLKGLHISRGSSFSNRHKVHGLTAQGCHTGTLLEGSSTNDFVAYRAQGCDTYMKLIVSQDGRACNNNTVDATYENAGSRLHFDIEAECKNNLFRGVFNPSKVVDLGRKNEFQR